MTVADYIATKAERDNRDMIDYLRSGLFNAEANSQIATIQKEFSTLRALCIAIADAGSADTCEDMFRACNRISWQTRVSE